MEGAFEKGQGPHRAAKPVMMKIKHSHGYINFNVCLLSYLPEFDKNSYTTLRLHYTSITMCMVHSLKFILRTTSLETQMNY
jgi:hypothetical protein